MKQSYMFLLLPLVIFITRNNSVHRCFNSLLAIYGMSIKYFPDYKHLLQENYLEYKYIIFTIT
jgi:hypothetical protein